MSRYTDVSNEPVTRILAPISDYEKVPLFTLEESIKPVAHLFDGIDENVQIAKNNSLSPANGLSQDESASLYLYTMPCNTGSSLYQILNQHLRSDDRQVLKPWFSFLNLFLTALHKLPSQAQTVWRGVPDRALGGQYPVGSQLTWWGISSCTSTQSLLEITQMNRRCIKTIFSIDCQNAKLITPHSHCRGTNEVEIILIPGTCFEVINQTYESFHTHRIFLKEIQTISSHISSSTVDQKYPSKRSLFMVHSCLF